MCSLTPNPAQSEATALLGGWGERLKALAASTKLV